ncbi:hypothetical protein TNCV_916591 [Trichonephila clavipes]|nr:hypothetical protein TNCV_916591 [Trichonephila clavipes]
MNREIFNLDQGMRMPSETTPHFSNFHTNVRTLRLDRFKINKPLYSVDLSVAPKFVLTIRQCHPRVRDPDRSYAGLAMSAVKIHKDQALLCQQSKYIKTNVSSQNK